MNKVLVIDDLWYFNYKQKYCSLSRKIDGLKGIRIPIHIEDHIKYNIRNFLYE